MKKFIVSSNLHPRIVIIARNLDDARSNYLASLSDTQYNKIVTSTISIAKA